MGIEIHIAAHLPKCARFTSIERALIGCESLQTLLVGSSALPDSRRKLCVAELIHTSIAGMTSSLPEDTNPKVDVTAGDLSDLLKKPIRNRRQLV
ncbi:hypothetical protein DU484_07445 [Haloplanus rubicundus]|uniref:Uncharacterized protein n=1 Tax=Haloplanus rubicundus TaxID=1547898 RepID=A0A345EBY6_9EURY|nr:hypothetical protein DU484_07445 [Haloplanus rubicundus]